MWKIEENFDYSYWLTNKAITRAQEKYTYIDRLRAQYCHPAYPENTQPTARTDTDGAKNVSFLSSPGFVGVQMPEEPPHLHDFRTRRLVTKSLTDKILQFDGQ